MGNDWQKSSLGLLLSALVRGPGRVFWVLVIVFSNAAQETD